MWDRFARPWAIGPGLRERIKSTEALCGSRLLTERKRERERSAHRCFILPRDNTFIARRYRIYGLTRGPFREANKPIQIQSIQQPRPAFDLVVMFMCIYIYIIYINLHLDHGVRSPEALIDRWLTHSCCCCWCSGLIKVPLLRMNSCCRYLFSRALISLNTSSVYKREREREEREACLSSFPSRRENSRLYWQHL